MNQSVYIETSVVSYYTGEVSRDIVIAGHQASTKDFWDKLNIAGRRVMKDPFVAEVRKHRMEHTKKFNSDIHAICKDLREYQDALYAQADIDKNKTFANKTSPANR